jgi:hypothetical protein
VLGHLFSGVRVPDSAAWLRGSELPDDALRALGLASVHEEEDSEASSRRIALLLCHLVEPTPVVLCLDQLESIQSFSGDRSGFFSIGKVVSSLHDETRNVALLSCLQTSLMGDLEAAVRGADADRMHKRRGSLIPLSFDQAVRLASARLDSVAELREQRQSSSNPIWPLDPEDLRPLFSVDGLCVARKVIVRCQDLFNAWLDQPPEQEVEAVDAMLDRTLQQRQRDVPLDRSDEVLRTGLPLLFNLRRMSFRAANTLRPVAIDGRLDGPVPAAIAVCNQDARGSGLSHRLEKIASDWQGEPARLLLFRDVRRGIGANARITRAKLDELEKRGARLVMVEQEALSALDALGTLLADARSGDLSHRGEAVSASAVERWLSSHLPASLDRLLDQVAGEPPTSDLLPAMMDLVSTAKVLRVDDAAAQLGKSPEEVEECARRSAASIGYAGGATRVLFETVRSPGSS